MWVRLVVSAMLFLCHVCEWVVWVVLMFCLQRFRSLVLRVKTAMHLRTLSGIRIHACVVSSRINYIFGHAYAIKHAIK